MCSEWKSKSKCQGSIFLLDKLKYQYRNLKFFYKIIVSTTFVKQVLDRLYFSGSFYSFLNSFLYSWLGRWTEIPNLNFFLRKLRIMNFNKIIVFTSFVIQKSNLVSFILFFNFLWIIFYISSGKNSKEICKFQQNSCFHIFYLQCCTARIGPFFEKRWK